MLDVIFRKSIVQRQYLGRLEISATFQNRAGQNTGPNPFSEPPLTISASVKDEKIPREHIKTIQLVCSESPFIRLISETVAAVGGECQADIFIRSSR